MPVKVPNASDDPRDKDGPDNLRGDRPPPAPLRMPREAITIRQGELEDFGTRVWAQAVHWVALNSGATVTGDQLAASLAANPYDSTPGV